LLANGMMPIGLGEEVARWYMRAVLEVFDWKVSLAECLPKRKVCNMPPHLPRGLIASGMRTILVSRREPMMST
jgi:hypothetical protein